MKVVRLSALHTSHLYSSGNIPGTYFIRGWVNPRATVRPEGLGQQKISKNATRNQTHNIPACRVVPQTNRATAYTPNYGCKTCNYKWNNVTSEAHHHQIVVADTVAVVVVNCSLFIIFFVQGIYTYKAKTNHDPREYSIAAIL
jgi:hypothetical protein